MNKVEKSIYGYIFGDAYGLPFEGRLRGRTETNRELINENNIGIWRVPYGTWSDDTAMTLITMEHLIENEAIEGLKSKFCDWMYEGYWSYDMKPAFDVGAIVGELIQKWENESIAAESRKDEQSNGNGALMRMLPIAFKTYKAQNINETIDKYSSLTHGHIRSILACRHYVYVIHNILDGLDIEESINVANEKLENDVIEANEEEHFLNLKRISEMGKDEIKSEAYVMDTLEAVYWSLMNSKDYLDSIDIAVNLGRDTDTIAAITGSISALYYDEINVSDTWYKTIPRNKDIEKLLKRFSGSIS